MNCDNLDSFNRNKWLKNRATFVKFELLLSNLEILRKFALHSVKSMSVSSNSKSSSQKCFPPVCKCLRSKDYYKIEMWNKRVSNFKFIQNPIKNIPLQYHEFFHVSQNTNCARKLSQFNFTWNGNITVGENHIRKCALNLSSKYLKFDNFFNFRLLHDCTLHSGQYD